MTTQTPDSPLVQQLMEQLQGAPLQQIAQQLGTSEQQAGSAAAMALPVLLGALGRNTQDAQGAQALLGALQRDHTPAAGLAGAQGALDLGGLLGAVLGGAPAGGAGTAGAGGPGAGAAILGHMLGAGRGQVESGLGQAIGLGAQAGPLLQMLAPLVMQFLGQRVQGGGLDASGLGQMLGQERAQLQRPGSPAGDLLGRLLDQDGDGQFGMGDLLKIGAGLLGGRR